MGPVAFKQFIPKIGLKLVTGVYEVNGLLNLGPRIELNDRSRPKISRSERKAHSHEQQGTYTCTLTARQ